LGFSFIARNNVKHKHKPFNNNSNLKRMPPALGLLDVYSLLQPQRMQHLKVQHPFSIPSVCLRSLCL
jgi:hypothetical protein